MALESKYQKELIRKLQDMFPKCIVVKNDPNYIQGIPDLLVLHNDKWAALECKRNSRASHRPNQDYYVNRMEEMSFAAFIFPENEEYVLNRLRKYFMFEQGENYVHKTKEDGHAIQRPQKAKRSSRISKCV